MSLRHTTTPKKSKPAATVSFEEPETVDVGTFVPDYEMSSEETSDAEVAEVKLPEVTDEQDPAAQDAEAEDSDDTVEMPVKGVPMRLVDPPRARADGALGGSTPARGGKKSKKGKHREQRKKSIAGVPKRHQKITRTNDITRNWKSASVRRLCRKAGVCRISKDALAIAAYVLQAQMRCGMDAAVVYMGKRKTLSTQDVINGFKCRFGQTLLN